MNVVLSILHRGDRLYSTVDRSFSRVPAAGEILFLDDADYYVMKVRQVRWMTSGTPILDLDPPADNLLSDDEADRLGFHRFDETLLDRQLRRLLEES